VHDGRATGEIRIGALGFTIVERKYVVLHRLKVKQLLEFGNHTFAARTVVAVQAGDIARLRELLRKAVQFEPSQGRRQIIK